MRCRPPAPPPPPPHPPPPRTPAAVDAGVLQVAERLVGLAHDVGLAVDVQHRLLPQVVPQHAARACGGGGGKLSQREPLHAACGACVCGGGGGSARLGRARGGGGRGRAWARRRTLGRAHGVKKVAHAAHCRDGHAVDGQALNLRGARGRARGGWGGGRRPPAEGALPRAPGAGEEPLRPPARRGGGGGGGGARLAEVWRALQQRRQLGVLASCGGAARAGARSAGRRARAAPSAAHTAAPRAGAAALGGTPPPINISI